MREENIVLKDGRKLAFAVYGPAEGRPVFYFHGTPSSRLEPQILGIYGVDLDSLLMISNLRLIAVDRPGMGLSDFNRKGEYLSFADDVKELADRLSISSCQVMCWSGGGPFALALVSQYPQTVFACHIICGFTRKFDREVETQMGMNKWYFIIAHRAPGMLRLAINAFRKKRIKKRLPQWITGLPYVDFQLIAEPHLLENMSRLSMEEAAAQGARGVVYEAKGYYREPGFLLSDIKVPVHYWWGTSDMSVIRLHAEAIEKEVPRAVMHYRENEGHLSLYVNCFKDVLEVISRIATADGKGIA